MFDILATGRDRDDLLKVEEMLRRQGGVTVRKRQLVYGLTDPLSDLEQMPDLLVLSLNEESGEELNALDRRPPSERPSVLVIGPSGNTELMRMAMRAGARDYFFQPLQATEFLGAVDRAVRERQSASNDAKQRFTVTVNAKGGAGASVIATNLAHIFATHFGLKTALVDMDLQFGSLALNFDATANDGLLQAIESIDNLDSMALEGWAIKHPSGVHLFGTTHKNLVLSADIPDDRLGRFYNLLARSYEQTVIDLPRQIDHLFATTINRADRIVVVMQQSLAQLRDAKTLLGILQTELMVPTPHIVVVVNRYSKKATISLKDIENAMPDISVITIPNDYQQITQSLNTGVPLLEFAAKSNISRDMVSMAAKISGVAPAKRGFFRRILGAEGS